MTTPDLKAIKEANVGKEGYTSSGDPIYNASYDPKVVSEGANEYGLLIDYEFCTDCHSCEVACKKELNLPTGQNGIKVLEYGPIKTPDGKWEWTYLPLPTDLCTLCEDRTAKGKLPTCVHHCQAGIMYYGTIKELAAKAAEKPKMVLFTR